MLHYSIRVLIIMSLYLPYLRFRAYKVLVPIIKARLGSGWAFVHICSVRRATDTGCDCLQRSSDP